MSESTPLDTTPENPGEQVQEQETRPAFRILPFFSHQQAVFLLMIIGLIFYARSLNNEYALDDGIKIHQNDYVLRGIRGIGDILTHDEYKSFYDRMHATDQLAGGRYRPLPIISYALEQEMIGPYRTGYYMMVQDLNHNGKLDPDQVVYRGPHGDEMNYEYNDFVDLNGDFVAQPNECYNCWDTDHDFRNDPEEDVNSDGIFNEIDCQVYGAMMRHMTNILLFLVCIYCVYHLFSRYLFKTQPDLGFVSAFIFAIHPVHSEVIANVKGREDILALIFICLCLGSALKYLEHKRPMTALLSGFWGFLALMSKEAGISLFFLVPLAAFVFGSEVKLRRALVPVLTFILFVATMIVVDNHVHWGAFPPLVAYLTATAIYGLIMLLVLRRDQEPGDFGILYAVLCIFGLFFLSLRLNAVNMDPGVPDTELLNNPYLLASKPETFATKVYTLLVYARIYLFPHPLVSDYSYNTIQYRSLLSWDFIVSAVLHLFLIVLAVNLCRKRSPLGFALATYLISILMVSSIFFPTHIMLLEANIFQASLGGCILIGWIILQIVNRLSEKKLRPALISILFVLFVLAGIKTWERCGDWKNDVTLFLKDVKNAPNSVLILGNAGARWIDLADTKEITGIEIPGQNAPFNDYNGQLHISDEELDLSGCKDKRELALRRGVGYLRHAVELHPRYVNGYLNLGLAYYKLANEDSIMLYWKIAEHYYPNNPYLNNYYQVYGNLLNSKGSSAFSAQDYPAAEHYFKQYIMIHPEQADGYKSLGAVYINMGRMDLAKKYLEKASKINPGSEEIKTMKKVAGC